MSPYTAPVRLYPVSTPWRKPGKMWASGYHTGLDIAAPTGTPVYAVAEGDVRSVDRARIYGKQNTGPYGKYVIVNDDVDGSDWAYCHLSRVVTHEGQHVTAGQLIGYVGATGNVDGPHLHLERRPRGGAYGTDLNPLVWATAPATKTTSTGGTTVAAPMTNAQLLDALKREGCKVHEVTGWQSHNRNSRGPWGGINGVMIHHTGSDVQGATYVNNILRSGYSGLPGPLCHVGIGMDGTVYLVSNGRSNHAGGGDPAVLKAVADEAPWLMEREAKPTKGNSNGTDGNAHFYAAEVMYDGGQPMTADQEDASVRFAAAICRHYGWSARSAIGHREWSRDKIDPGKESMVTFRKLVQARLDKPPEAKTTAANAVKAASSPARVGNVPWKGYGRPISFKAYAAGVKSGKPSGNVKLVQQMLAAQKPKGGKPYYAGAIDGVAGPTFTAAVKAYQIALGYSGSDADGELGPQQFGQLVSWAMWKPIA